MKRKWVKSLLVFLGQIVVITIVVTAISIGTQGMYLLGIPAVDKVESVTIEGREFTDPEQIELAVKLTGFLRYDLFGAPQEGEPLITIVYHLKDKDIEISANRETVWWQGKAYAIKEPDMFVNLTEGIFF